MKSAIFLVWGAPPSWLADRRGAMWRGRVVPCARAWPVAIRESTQKKRGWALAIWFSCNGFIRVQLGSDLVLKRGCGVQYVGAKCVCVCVCVCNERSVPWGSQKEEAENEARKSGRTGCFRSLLHVSVCVCGSACDSLMSSSTLYAAMFAGRRACFYQLFSSLNAEKVCRYNLRNRSRRRPHTNTFWYVFLLLFGLVSNREIICLNLYLIAALINH